MPTDVNRRHRDTAAVNGAVRAEVAMIGLAQLRTGGCSLVAGGDGFAGGCGLAGNTAGSVAGLALRLLPKTPAAVRFAIWFGVFLVVAALPVLSLCPRG